MDESGGCGFRDECQGDLRDACRALRGCHTLADGGGEEICETH